MLAAGPSRMQVWKITHNALVPLGESTEVAAESIWWAQLSPDGQYAVCGGARQAMELFRVSGEGLQPVGQLIGHRGTVMRGFFTGDGHVVSAGADASVRFWDIDSQTQLFSLNLPAQAYPPLPLADFDFRCEPRNCRLAVPLNRGLLAVYDMGPASR